MVLGPAGNYLLVRRSRNRKTGPIAVTYSPQANCPTVCPHHECNRGTCYAKCGRDELVWRRLAAGTAGTSWFHHVEAIARLPEDSLLRINVAGDLPGLGNTVDEPAVLDLIAACYTSRVIAWTYTHKPVTERLATLLRITQQPPYHWGLRIRLSADSLADCDRLAQYAPVSLTLPVGEEPKYTPAGRPVWVCRAPEQYSCADCRRCFRDRGDVVIAFRAHGNQAKHVTYTSN